MKTIAKTLIAAIALLFAMQINAAPINGGPISSTNEIQYSVKINSTQIHSGSFNLNLFVMITDEHGRLVAPVQAVRPGLSTYHFSEFGPVIGTRVARLIYDPIGPTEIHARLGTILRERKKPFPCPTGKDDDQAVVEQR